MTDFRPIYDCIDDLTVFWESLQSDWHRRGGSPDINIAQYPKEKILSKTSEQLSGVVGYFHDSPVCFGFVDRLTPTYGDLTLYSLYPEFRRPLVKTIIDAHFLDEVHCELLQYENTPVYSEALNAYGASENARTRMCLNLSEFNIPQLSMPTTLKITPHLLDYAHLAGPISAAAHRQSKDYVGYADLEEDAPRIALDHRLFSGFYGPIIPEGTLALWENERLIGVCEVVSIKGWGLDELPWIFDISIDPAFHGQKKGKYLLLEILHRLKEKGYPLIGLAVTKTNVAAIALYDALGFTITDDFNEYVVFVPKETS